MDEFGFDAIFDEGVNEQEVTEPADEVAEDDIPEEGEGENEQEPAEPAQSAEENAKYAAARRKAEKDVDERIRRAVEEAKRASAEEYTSVIKGMGILNPYNGKPLESMEDLKAYAEAAAKEQREEAESKLNEYGLSREQIDALVQNHPEVVAARESSARLKDLESKAQVARDRQVLDDELAKIQEFDPSIKDISDFMKDEHHEEMRQMVKEGKKIHEAWILTHLQNIVDKTASATKQETINKVRGKAHLEKSSSRGEGGVTIPADVLAEYQALNPDASVEDIRKFHERDIKRMKKKG